MTKANQKRKKVTGGQHLPADADVDFVLHAPGRDYDVVELLDLDEDDAVEEFDSDIDEEADTGVWEAPLPHQTAAADDDENPWWKAARDGVRVRSSFHEGARKELAWWEAARMGLRAPEE